YRSRHQSLIAVSNAEFYKQLIMPPAAKTDRASEGLILRRVPGAYDRGGKRTNLIEAEAVANAIASHAKTWTCRSASSLFRLPNAMRLRICWKSSGVATPPLTISCVKAKRR